MGRPGGRPKRTKRITEAVANLKGTVETGSIAEHDTCFEMDHAGGRTTCADPKIDRQVVTVIEVHIDGGALRVLHPGGRLEKAIVIEKLVEAQHTVKVLYSLRNVLSCIILDGQVQAKNLGDGCAGVEIVIVAADQMVIIQADTDIGKELRLVGRPYYVTLVSQADLRSINTEIDRSCAEADDKAAHFGIGSDDTRYPAIKAGKAGGAGLIIHQMAARHESYTRSISIKVGAPYRLSTGRVVQANPLSAIAGAKSDVLPKGQKITLHSSGIDNANIFTVLSKQGKLLCLSAEGRH